MNKASILIVEDEVIVAADLAERLHGLGYRVVGSVTTGEAAVSLAREQRPSLVLMDIQLAGAMDGIEAAALIQQSCDLPVVFLTAHSDQHTLEQAEAAGAFGYVLKPFEDRELRTQIEMALYRHAADRRLRESEARFAGIVESAMDAVITTDDDQRIVLFNKTAEVMFRCPAAEALGSTIERFIPERFRVAHQNGIRAFRQSSRTRRAAGVRLAVTGLRADGEEFPIEASVSTLEVAGQTLFTAILRDVTERARADEALKRSVARLKATLDSTTDGLLIVDLSGRITDFNQQFAEMWGLPESILAARDDEAAIKFVVEQLENPESFLAETQHLYAEPEERSFDVLTFKDGRIVERYSQPQRLDGEPVGRVWYFRDVTERKHAEGVLARFNATLEQLVTERTQSLKESEERLRMVLQASAMGTFEIDFASGETHWNTTEFELLGLKPGDAPAHPDTFLRFLHPDDAGRVRALWEEAERTGELDAEFRIVRADGEECWLAGKGRFASEGTAGGAPRFLGVNFDITERKQTERALAELNRKLIDASRQAGMAEVATGVLHNVGNVLNSVNISTTLLLERVRQSRHDTVADYARLLAEHREQLAEFLLNDPRGRLLPEIMVALADHLATEQAEHLRELESLAQSVGHLKQIVAMQQSYASLVGAIETVSVAELVEDALRLESAALDKRKVRVQRAFEPVPPITIDRHKVVQIVVNLIRNATHALASRGEGERCLVIGIAASGEGHIAIRVEDNGAGITPDDLEKIFSFGYTTRPDGHGFGLHHGANAAREMGGELHVHSAGPGQGATFTLRFRSTSA